MYWTKPFNEWFPIVKRGNEKIDDENIPAWGMHRLMELYLNSCDTRFEIRFNQKGIKSAYEFLTEIIEWLIKEGYFNKEYLV